MRASKQERLIAVNDRPVLYSILIILALFALWTLWGNVTIAITELEIASPELDAAFDEFKVVQVSDLHNAEFGAGNTRLLAKIQAAKPDVIAVTGDLVDSENTDILLALDFLENALDIAPCYYVSGNHEAWLNEAYAELEAQMLALGVNVLHGESVTLERGQGALTLTGVDDPRFAEQGVDVSIPPAGDGFQLLLAHRPDGFEDYVQAGYDLVLAGHMHGGQFRIPFVGGLIGSNTELFPQYDAGVFQGGNTTMIVSRGLGNSVIPIRINNRPELVVVTLNSEH